MERGGGGCQKHLLVLLGATGVKACAEGQCHRLAFERGYLLQLF